MADLAKLAKLQVQLEAAVDAKQFKLAGEIQQKIDTERSSSGATMSSEEQELLRLKKEIALAAASLDFDKAARLQTEYDEKAKDVAVTPKIEIDDVDARCDEITGDMLISVS